MPIAAMLCSISIAATAAPTASDDIVRGEPLRAWGLVTLVVDGPIADESADPNPFLDVRMTARFEHIDGGPPAIVPGYYAADGDAADTGATVGRRWVAHFVPERPGHWSFEVSIRKGAGIALSDVPEAGEPAEGDGTSGTFEVTPDPEAKGILRHDGGRYLRFAASGEAFLKGGADSPENFLAYEDFDGTRSTRQGDDRRPGEADGAGLHTYAPHLRDWSEGDPSWGEGRGKGIIGALNYLASEGVNSVYFLAMNVRGDGRDVWPWLDIDDRRRFDVSKLAQWERVFRHMDDLGIALHLVLTETENESLFEHEEGGVDFAESRRLYYRELIARFGHHRGLVWNLGEENGGHNDREPDPYGFSNTDDQRRAFADAIRALDPYDHPIVVHTFPGQYEKIYAPLLGHPSIDGPSLQMGDMTRTHAETIRWIDASEEAGRPWFVCLDEIGPADTGAKPDADDPDHDEPRQHALWGNLMAGGAGVEWYFGYTFPNNDLNCEDFRSRDRLWDQTRIALDFFRQHLPFTEMTHADEVVTSPEGSYGFALHGQVYAVYLPEARDARLDLAPGRYNVRWYDPRRGGDLQTGPVDAVEGGEGVVIGAPPGRF